MAKTIPVFRVFDYNKRIEFYINWLGCDVLWELRPEKGPFYMRIAIRDVEINLSEHHGECSPGALIVIEDFKNLKQYHQTLIDKHYPFMLPGISTPEWDAHTLTTTVIDPFYNRIQFMEKVNK
jgi:hypothetical protein